MLYFLSYHDGRPFAVSSPPPHAERAMTSAHRPPSPDTRTRQPEPPAPPAHVRRLALTRKQWVGVPLLLAVPVLTLLGTFGESRAIARAASPTLALTVRYPSRFRYRQIQPLELTVENRSGQPMDSVRVSLDTAYITRFSSVRIDPAPQRDFVVRLDGVRPGESRLVAAELWGERYGVHRGRVVAATTTDSVAVDVRTVVFP